MTVLRGTVIAGGTRIDDGAVEIEGERIVRVGPARDGDGPAEPGTLLLPGLVDVHCHGGAGHGFPDAGADGVRAAAAHHLAHGTTSLLGSLVSASGETLLERVRLLAPLVDTGELAGIHLEGPFLAAAQCGAQDPSAIVPGDPGLLARLLDAGAGHVRSMTLAPETPRYRDLLAVMQRHGVVPSLGHTDASAAATTAGIAQAGQRPLSATHLFNGMPPLHHRAPGPVAACLAAAGRGAMVLELVADGVHLADETVAMVFDLVGPDRIALVTDAMAAAGMSDGRYRLGALDVDVADGVARLAAQIGRPAERAGERAPDGTGLVPGGGVERPLAGGTARLIDVVRRVVRHAGVPLPAAVTAATATPARLLGLHDVGALVAGHRADVLVTDAALTPRAVMRAGHWITRERQREVV
ncbi:MAG: N-acetylglucosamine-6-phosphate deacetylase [Pseudonocardiales bacterium]|nr:N-acetylglucosamine-6-phosphate deacetylase [Pseudonocardiales bacterium]